MVRGKKSSMLLKTQLLGVHTTTMLAWKQGVFGHRTIHFPIEVVPPSQLYKDVNQLTHD